MLKNFATVISSEMMLQINPTTDCINELNLFSKLENECLVTLTFTL